MNVPLQLWSAPIAASRRNAVERTLILDKLVSCQKHVEEKWLESEAEKLRTWNLVHLPDLPAAQFRAACSHHRNAPLSSRFEVISATADEATRPSRHARPP